MGLWKTVPVVLGRTRPLGPESVDWCCHWHPGKAALSLRTGVENAWIIHSTHGIECRCLGVLKFFAVLAKGKRIRAPILFAGFLIRLMETGGSGRSGSRFSPEHLTGSSAIKIADALGGQNG